MTPATIDEISKQSEGRQDDAEDDLEDHPQPEWRKTRPHQRRARGPTQPQRGETRWREKTGWRQRRPVIQFYYFSKVYFFTVFNVYLTAFCLILLILNETASECVWFFIERSTALVGLYHWSDLVRPSSKQVMWCTESDLIMTLPYCLNLLPFVRSFYFI